MRRIRVSVEATYSHFQKKSVQKPPAPSCPSSEVQAHCLVLEPLCSCLKPPPPTLQGTPGQAAPCPAPDAAQAFAPAAVPRGSAAPLQRHGGCVPLPPWLTLSAWQWCLFCTVSPLTLLHLVVLRLSCASLTDRCCVL